MDTTIAGLGLPTDQLDAARQRRQDAPKHDVGQLPEPPTQPNTDKLALSTLDAETTLRLLQERLLARVQEQTGQRRGSETVADLTPSVLAGRMIGLGRLLAAQTPDSERPPRLAAFENALRVGFDETRAGISLLAPPDQQPRHHGLVNTTRALIEQGVAALREDYGIHSGQIQQQLQRSETGMTLNIRTRDGDNITLQFIQREDRYQEDVQLQGDDQSLHASSAVTDRYSRFELSIEGDLNDEERAGIAALVGDLDTLVQAVANGQDPATAIPGLDSSLAGFDFAMIAREQTYQRDIAWQPPAAQPEQAPALEQEPAGKLEVPLYAQQLNEIMQRQRDARRLEQPGQAMSLILQALIDTLPDKDRQKLTDNPYIQQFLQLHRE